MYLSKYRNIDLTRNFNRYNRIANFYVDKLCLRTKFFIIRHLRVLTDDISDMKTYKRMVSRL